MPIHKITQTDYDKLLREKVPGLYGDGGKLYLQILPTGSMSWLFRYRHQGRARALGLGPTHTVDLAAAREAARVQRVIVHEGRDPIAERRARLPVMSFESVVQHYLDNGRPNQGWASQLEQYCKPIAKRPVDLITSDDIFSLVHPIWRTKHPTAKKLLGRIECVFDFATQMDPPQLKGDNPAAWKKLNHRLPATVTVHTSDNLEAMPYGDVPAFLAHLRARDGDIAARALEFTMLTCCRTGDIIGKPEVERKGIVVKPAKPPVLWSDIDWEQCTWTPPQPVGRKRLLQVPLTAAAMAVLRLAKSYGLDREVVFPIGKNAMYNVLRELAPGHAYTVHGFRASFKTWTDDETTVHPDVAEQCLSHKIVGEQVAKAYRRGNPMFDKRAELLDTWSAFIGGQEGNVVILRKPRAGAMVPAVAA